MERIDAIKTLLSFAKQATDLGRVCKGNHMVGKTLIPDRCSGFVVPQVHLTQLEMAEIREAIEVLGL